MPKFYIQYGFSIPRARSLLFIPILRLSSISPIRGPLSSSVNVALGSNLNHSSHYRSNHDQVSLETPNGSRDDSNFSSNGRSGGSESGKLK